jgi:hypothetical protein
MMVVPDFTEESCQYRLGYLRRSGVVGNILQMYCS